MANLDFTAVLPALLPSGSAMDELEMDALQSEALAINAVEPTFAALPALTLGAVETNSEQELLSPSGNPYIDSLLWGGETVGTGPGTVISYSFLNENPEGIGIFSDFYYAWMSYEIEAAQLALQTWENVANLSFVQVPDDSPEADFNLAITDNLSLFDGLGLFIPPGELGSGLGLFNFEAPSWDAVGLMPGGNGFVTLVHELGHGLGLAHPHDNGGGSTIFPGVVFPEDLGTDELNQGVWTTMSYNDGLLSDDLPFNSPFGYQATPMALDIAAVQALYGANWSYNLGDDLYSLPTNNAPGTFYEAIWDAGGNDTINVAAYTTADAVINLNAAPLTGPNAGGYLSKVEGIAGVTIAHGVTIENAIGSGGNDILIGNLADNFLDGDAGDDVLDGLGGDDILYGWTGNDTLLGFDGDDLLYGEAGDDQLEGESGHDWLDGGAGNDVLDGGEGNDILEGGTGDDQLDGGAGNDRLLGATGDDVLSGGEGDDFLFGESGHDQLMGEMGDDQVFGADGNDELLGGEGHDQLFGELGLDVLNGGSGNDDLYGGAGNDALDGGVGDDLLEGDAGNDQLLGFDGNDLLKGGEGNDQLYGELGDDSLEGGLGDDQLYGGAGHDSLFGFDGDDTLQGGVGEDYLEGGLGDDSLNGGADSDSLYGGTGSDYLDGMAGNDYLAGGAGQDILLGFDGDDGLDGGSGNDLLNGELGDDQLYGGSGNDDLDGGAGNDLLNGGAGNDILWGNFGSDVLVGGGGQDHFLYVAGDGLDVITDFGGVGTGPIASAEAIAELDQLQFVGAGLTADKLILTETEQGLLLGFESLDPFLAQVDSVVLLENFALESLDNLPANASTPFVHGNILFDGQSALEDSFDVFNADANLNQVLNLNTVTFLNDLDNQTTGFSQSDDVINGQGGDDSLWGLSGDDILRGGSGDDTLVGGAGLDQLWGGEGCDRFLLEINQGLDFIFDFQVNHDVLGLTVGLSLGSLAIDQLEIDGVTGTLLSHQVTGEGLAFLSGTELQSLTSENFVFA